MSSKQNDEKKPKKKSNFFKTISSLPKFSKCEKKKNPSHASQENASKENASNTSKHTNGEFSNYFNHHVKEEQWMTRHDSPPTSPMSEKCECEFSNSFMHHVNEEQWMTRHDSPPKYQYNGDRLGEEFLKTTYYFDDHYAQGCVIM